MNAQTTRALSLTASFPAIFKQTSQQTTLVRSTLLAMPAIPNYCENRVVSIAHPSTSAHHSRSSSLSTITTFTSLAASRPLAIQASVTALEDRTPTPQTSRQEQSPGDPMVIDSPDNGATPVGPLLVRLPTTNQ